MTAFVDPNDEINIYNSNFTLLPIRIFSNKLSLQTFTSNIETELLFENCIFYKLNNLTAFNFETLGNSWYPNITFDSSLFVDTKINVIENGTISDPAFYSSIILKQCTFEQVSGTAVNHKFIIAPIIPRGCNIGGSDG